jgi:nucleoside permease NupC
MNGLANELGVGLYCLPGFTAERGASRRDGRVVVLMEVEGRLAAVSVVTVSNMPATFISGWLKAMWAMLGQSLNVYVEPIAFVLGMATDVSAEHL